MRTRRWLFHMLNPRGHNPWGRTLELTIITLIAVDLVVFVLDSVPSVKKAYGGVFSDFEHFVICVFTAEYAARLWTCKVDPRYDGPWGRLRYLVSPLAIIDLLAILPVLALVPNLPLVGGLFPEELTALRSFRLLRLLRIGKIARYSYSLQTLGRAVRKIRRELAVIFFMLTILVLVAGALLYATEHEAQPEKFKTIPHAMWYAIVVMTTLGFGDVVAATGMGKLVTALLAVAGIGLFTVPAGLLGATFVEELRDKFEKRRPEERLRKVYCPNCQEWVPLGARPIDEHGTLPAEELRGSPES